MPLKNLTRPLLKCMHFKGEKVRRKKFRDRSRVGVEEEGGREAGAREAGMDLKLQLDELYISKYLPNNYSKNKRELLGKNNYSSSTTKTIAYVSRLCLLIIQLLSPNMFNHFKCETHKMSSQFILRVSSWQSVERIRGLSGLAIYKTRQKHKNFFFKCQTDVMILMTCILSYLLLRMDYISGN